MKRPTVVTVFGVLNIVFGAFGVIGIFVSAALFFAPIDSNNPVVRLLHDENSAYSTYLKGSLVFGVLACLVLLAAGIGLLSMKPWARKLSIAYALYAIIAGLAGMVGNYFFLIRPMLEQAQHQQGPEATGAAIGGAIGGSVGGCIGLIYPVLLLIFMTRPKVVESFQTPPASA